MSRYIIGPEMLWLIIYVFARMFSKLNKAPDHTLDNFIEQCWFWVPVLVLSTFGLYWISGVEKNWLLLRIWIVGIIMGHLVLETVMKAYSNQGPGIGMGYLAGMLFLFILLVAGSILVKIVF
jgi:hypothetical protein